jgi:hypothetical protein
MFEILPEQPQLCPVLPTVEGNVDYDTFRQQLLRMDDLLRLGGVETDFLRRALRYWSRQAEPPLVNLSVKQPAKFQRASGQALRCGVAGALTQESYRAFSCHLADSVLLQRFCAVQRLGTVRVPSQSTVQRYDQWLPVAEMRALIEGLLQCRCAPADAGGRAPLGLQEPLDVIADWQLIRDQPLADSQLVPGSVKRVPGVLGSDRLREVAGDPGTASAANHDYLSEQGLYDALWHERTPFCRTTNRTRPNRRAGGHIQNQLCRATVTSERTSASRACGRLGRAGAQSVGAGAIGESAGRIAAAGASRLRTVFRPSCCDTSARGVSKSRLKRSPQKHKPASQRPARRFARARRSSQNLVTKKIELLGQALISVYSWLKTKILTPRRKGAKKKHLCELCGFA